MTSFARLTDYPPNHPGIRDDMTRRYENTYMVINIKGVLTPVCYIGSNTSKFVFSDINGNNIEFRPIDTDEINILLPKVGYYNVNGNPVYLVKLPQRQWKRSLCNSIYKILPPINTMGAMMTNGNIWFALAQEVLNPTYASLDDIRINLFANVAISRKFVVAKDTKGIPCLMYKRYKIAELDFKTRSVIVTQPLLMQEVRDLFKYTGVTTWTLQ